MTTIPPIVLWAQRSSATDDSKNVIFLTIEVVDPINTKLDLTATNLTLSADSSDKATHWDLNIDFFEEIDPEASVKNLDNGSHIYLVLKKKVAKDEYWPRLTKEKLKYHYIKTDFDKWVDEDEQDEVADQDDDLMGGAGGPGGPGGMGGMGGMDLSSLMGGAGGPGGMDFSKMMAGLGGAGGAGGDDVDLSQLASQLSEAGDKGDAGDGDDDENIEEIKKE